jgi:hypothetical protein
MKQKQLGTVVKKDRRNYLRQLDIFDPVKYGDVDINIIGAGGIGSFVAVALAKLGLERIFVFDGDKVEAHNLPNQLHCPDQLGMNKAEALSNKIENLTVKKITAAPAFWWPGMDLYGVVISAVDHMEKTKETKVPGRRELWGAIKENTDVRLFVDGRIGGEALRVLAIRPLADILKYEWFEQRMFPQDKAKELPCTARNIIDVGFQMAALVTNIVRKYLVSGTLEISEHDTVMDMKNLYIEKIRP